MNTPWSCRPSIHATPWTGDGSMPITDRFEIEERIYNAIDDFHKTA